MSKAVKILGDPVDKVFSSFKNNLIRRSRSAVANVKNFGHNIKQNDILHEKFNFFFLNEFAAVQI